MKILRTFIILLAFASSAPEFASAQDLSRIDREKLRQAERTADRFVERFRQTLDFETVWREFQVSDASCNYRLNGPWSRGDYERLKLSDALVERLYIAYSNCLYLSFAYRLSIIRIADGSNYDLSVEKLLPKEIRAAESKLVNIEVGDDGRPRPQNAKEVERVVAELDYLARLWRKHLPRNLMKSATWRANVKYLLSKEGIGHLGVYSGGQYDLCIPDDVKYYLVDRGLFYFYFIEEKGRMKVARFGLGN